MVDMCILHLLSTSVMHVLQNIHNTDVRCNTRLNPGGASESSQSSSAVTFKYKHYLCVVLVVLV